MIGLAWFFSFFCPMSVLEVPSRKCVPRLPYLVSNLITYLLGFHTDVL